MDLLVVVFLLFYIIIIDAKDVPHRGSAGSGAIRIPETSSEEDPSKVVAFLILEHDDKSEETEDSNYDADGLKVWSGLSDSSETDSSGDTNSDEYDDSDSDDSASESNYYHKEDYDSGEETDDSALVDGQPIILRKPWRTCLRKAAKMCKKACIVSYKNSCESSRCKSKFKKSMKKECKTNCKESFD